MRVVPWNRCDDELCIPCVDALGAAGFVRFLAKIPALEYGRNLSHMQWIPTPKMEQAIRQGLIEQSLILGGHNGKYYIPVNAEYEGRCVLGCGELQQIDAITPLVDGLKVDFSWHWRTTEIGVGGGLSYKRRRGVAYFRRTSNGLTIDQLELK